MARVPIEVQEMGFDFYYGMGAAYEFDIESVKYYDG